MRAMEAKTSCRARSIPRRSVESALTPSDLFLEPILLALEGGGDLGEFEVVIFDLALLDAQLFLGGGDIPLVPLDEPGEFLDSFAR